MLLSLVVPAITSGNNGRGSWVSTAQPYPAIVLGEMLATSDLPGGVVNLLTGFRKELVPTFATHTHLRAVSAVANADERKALALAAADSVKRTHFIKAEEKHDWYAEPAQSLYAVRDFLEFKTTGTTRSGLRVAFRLGIESAAERVSVSIRTKVLIGFPLQYVRKCHRFRNASDFFFHRHRRWRGAKFGDRQRGDGIAVARSSNDAHRRTARVAGGETRRQTRHRRRWCRRP